MSAVHEESTVIAVTEVPAESGYNYDDHDKEIRDLNIIWGVALGCVVISVCVIILFVSARYTCTISKTSDRFVRHTCRKNAYTCKTVVFRKRGHGIPPIEASPPAQYLQVISKCKCTEQDSQCINKRRSSLPTYFNGYEVHIKTNLYRSLRRSLSLGALNVDSPIPLCNLLEQERESDAESDQESKMIALDHIYEEIPIFQRQKYDYDTTSKAQEVVTVMGEVHAYK